MSRIEMSGYDFGRIMKACAKACSGRDIRESLRYIEMRANGTECVATSLDGFIMQQIKVKCAGEGVILIPGTIKPPKCETVIIEDQSNIRITYLDGGGNLIYAYELPKFEGPYFDWGTIIDDREEDVIHCNAHNLRNALAATVYADDGIISISIPKDRIKPIRIAANDVQAIVLPVRMCDESHYRRFGNWYKLLENKGGTGK